MFTERSQVRTVPVQQQEAVGQVVAQVVQQGGASLPHLGQALLLPGAQPFRGGALGPRQVPGQGQDLSVRDGRWATGLEPQQARRQILSRGTPIRKLRGPGEDQVAACQGFQAG